MKFFVHLSVSFFSLIFLLSTCVPAPRAEAEEAVQAFESFVTTTEEAVRSESLDTWEAVDSTYVVRQKQLMTYVDQMDNTMQTRVENLDKRYRAAARAFEQQAQQRNHQVMQQVAELAMWIDSVETAVQEGTASNWKDLSQAYRTQRHEMAQQLEEATDEVVAQVETLEMRYEAAQSAWEEAER